MLRAAAYCDDPEHAEDIAAILSRDIYVGVPAEIILTSLPGVVARRSASARANADASVFFANAANFPWRSQAQWFLREMARWGYLGADADLTSASAVFRPDLYAQAARSLGLSVPTAGVKTEGYHAGSWLLPASPTPILMGPDRFLDGARFDPDPGLGPGA